MPILTRVGPSAPGQNDCPPLQLVTGDAQNLTLWCDQPLASPVTTIHDNIVQEATTAWGWSSSCHPAFGNATTTWTGLFEPQDLSDLASAQSLYLSATTDAQRTAAELTAETVYARVAAKHIAIGVRTYGMPLNWTNDASAFIPTNTPASITPGAASAVWDGSHVLAFVGQDGYTYDPVAGTTTAAAAVTLAAAGTTAVYDGHDAYIFGGFQHSMPTDTDVASVDPPLDQIVRYNPTAGTGAVVGALPQGLAGAASFFDARDLPSKGCPMGCAYILGGVTVTKKNTATTSYVENGAIYQYNPTTGAIKSAGSLGSGFSRVWPTVAWDGQYAYIFGGSASGAPWAASPTSTILRYDPVGASVTTLSQNLPLALQGASAFWDGTAAYVLGGSNSAGQRTNQIIKFTPSPATVTTQTNVLPQNTAFGAAVWTGSVAYEVGGVGTGKIVKVPTATTPDLAQRLIQGATDFTASNLVVVPGQPSNIQFLSLDIRDANDSWKPAAVPALVPMTSMRVTYHVTYTSLNGDDLSRDFTIVVNDQPSALGANVTIRYGNNTILDASSVDADNLDYRAAYQDAQRTIIHTLPLTNITNSTTTVTTQLEHAAVILPIGATNATVCSRDLWTARADGLKSNANTTRLSISPAGTCRLIPDLSPLLVHQGVPLAVTLEYRAGGATWSANLSMVDNPSQHTAKLGQWNATTTLSQAGAIYTPNAYDTAIEPTLARLTVDVPTSLTAMQQADALGEIIRDLHQSINIVAVETEDLPLTPLLDQAIQNATQNDATIVLAPAGRLPQGLWTTNPLDKLMTINGLAASPLVLTIGSGGATGVDSWSRLGPTPNLAPKPDFVAPSAQGTTAGSVANALPFVEALVARGVHDPNVVRAALSSLAVATQSQTGAPATFWEQGFGTLELGTFVNLTTTSDLLNASQQQYQDADQTVTIARLARALNTSTTNVTSATPTQLLGLAIRPTSLLRAATAKTLLNLTIGAPALPAQPILDFGTVNYAKPGRARFAPISVDTIINATTPNARELLRSAGYSGSGLTNATQTLQDASRANAENGQNVTTNTTFYNLFDLLNQGDYLYTTYGTLLDDQINNALPGTILNWSAINDTRSKITPWKLPTYYFVNETTTTTKLPITVNATCPQVPAASTLSLANTVLQALRGEASLLAHDPNRLLAERAVAAANASIQRANTSAVFVNPRTQGALLTCASDQLTLIQSLRDNATTLKTLRLESSGNWTTGEALNGTWNDTILGRQFRNATALLGLDASTIGPSQALVLDAVLDALNRSIALLSQTAPTIVAPQYDSGQPTGTTELFTNADKTRIAPLGPYVGIARMTSHNVSTINPLTGRATNTRNVTIPAPALLFNNPTLVWRETYRDSSPYAGAPAKIFDGDGQVFNSTRTNYSSRANDGVIVDFSLNTTPALVSILAQIAADQTQLQQVAAASHPELGPYTRAFQRAVQDANTSLANWSTSLNGQLARQRALDNATASPEDPSTRFALNELMSATYSHLTYQSGVLNQSGQIEWGTTFPGVYNLFSLYPYFTRIQQGTDYPYAAPGKGALEGPMGDLDMSVGKLAHSALETLPEHPTSPSLDGPEASDPDLLSTSVGGASIFETQTHDWNFAPLNQFALEVTGPDLPSAACADLNQFNALAQTNLAYPSCNAFTLISNTTTNARSNITHDYAYAQCALGQIHQTLNSADEAACTGLHASLEQGKQDCRDANADPIRRAQQTARGAPDPCWERFHAIEQLENATLNVTADLGALATQHVTTLVPWVRSPARVLCANPANLGFTVDSLLPRTRARNPGVSDATLRDDIASILAQCDANARSSIHAVPPANRTKYDYILATAEMSHITDKVSGLDWTRFDIERTTAAVPNSGSVVLTTQNAATLFSSTIHDEDRILVQKLHDKLAVINSSNPAGILSAFNSARQSAAANRLTLWDHGWRPNGTVTIGGLNLSGSLPLPSTRTEQACKDLAVTNTGVPGPYFNCHELDAALLPNILDYGGVDRVQYANALIEQARSHKAELDAGTLPSEIALLMLANATSLAYTPNVTYTERANNALLTNVTTSSSYQPALGVLLYSTPVPEGEYLRYRIDGQFLLQNSGALIITTANPKVTRGVIDAVQHYSLSTAPKKDSVALATNLVYAVDNIVQTSVQGADSLTRVDVIGLPIGVDTTGHPQDHPTDVSWANTVTIHTDPFLNYSRSHEMNTKYRGVSELDTIIVYFPSILLSASSTLVNEKFMLDNFSIQLDTYIGWHPGENVGTSKSDSTATAIRFRENVEDFHLYFSVPDELAPTTTGQSSDLVATVTGFGTYSFAVTRANLTLAPDMFWTMPPDPMGNAHSPTATMGSQSSCPNTAASGFWRSRAYPSRGITGQAEIFASDLLNDCVTNTIQNNEAKHVTGPPHPMTYESDPKKNVKDGLAYNYNVGNSEQQTVARPACATPTLSNLPPLISNGRGRASSLLSLENPPDVTSIEDKLTLTLAEEAQAIIGLKTVLATRASAGLGASAPFAQPSYEPEGPACDDLTSTSFPVLHNYIVLNRTDAESLMADVWDSQSQIIVDDGTNPSREAFVETNLTTITPYGQSLGEARGPSKDPAVSAVSFLLQALGAVPVGIGIQTPTVQTVDVLSANGITGAGFAIHATQTDTTTFTPQIDASPPTSATTSTFALTAYAIGGAHTAGSNCHDVPAITLALRAYRCTGYEHAASTPTLTFGSTAPCYTPAVNLFQAARAKATNPIGGEAFGQSDPERAALERLTGPTASASLNETSFNSTVQTAIAANVDVTSKAAILADCLQTSVPNLLPPVYLGSLIEQAQANVSSAIQAAQRIGSTQNISLPLQNVTALLKPDLLNGEPKHLVDLSISVAGVSLDGFTHQIGPTLVAYTLQDWSTHLQSGNLTLTITTPTGTSVTTLATFTNDTSGLLRANATITNVTGASTYTLVLKAFDDNNHVINGTKTFGTDIVLPELALTLPSGSTYTKLASYSVHATAWDNQSGLRLVQVEMRPPAGNWSTVFTMDPNLAGTSGPIQFDQTLDLSLATTAQQYGFRVNVTDRAGNVVTTSPSWLVVDKTAPDLTGLFTNALGTTSAYILSPTLSETVTASDPISGLASWRIWTYNTSSHTETTLNSSASLSGSFQTQSDSTTGWLGYTYTLNASVTDVAGNTNNTTFTSVVVRGQPSVKLNVPGWLHQQSTPSMHIGGNVQIVNFSGEKVDYLRFNYWPPGSNKISFQFGNITNKVGDFDLWWNFTEPTTNDTLPPGPYVIGLTAVRGLSADFIGSRINLTAAANGTFPLGEDTAIGVLAASSIAADTYTFARTCGGSDFTVAVVDNSTYLGGSAQTLNFTLSQTSPTSANIPTPPTAGTAPTATWAGAPAGSYTLTVTHTSSATAPYEVHYSLCNEPASTGSPDPGPREPPTHDAAQLQLVGQT